MVVQGWVGLKVMEFKDGWIEVGEDLHHQPYSQKSVPLTHCTGNSHYLPNTDTVYEVVLIPAGFSTVMLYTPSSISVSTGSTTRVDVAIGGSKPLFRIVTRSVALVSSDPSSVHVILVMGRLKPAMSTDISSVSPTVRLRASSLGVTGAAKEIRIHTVIDEGMT